MFKSIEVTNSDEDYPKNETSKSPDTRSFGDDFET